MSLEPVRQSRGVHDSSGAGGAARGGGKTPHASVVFPKPSPVLARLGVNHLRAERGEAGLEEREPAFGGELVMLPACGVERSSIVRSRKGILRFPSCCVAARRGHAEFDVQYSTLYLIL